MADHTMGSCNQSPIDPTRRTVMKAAAGATAISIIWAEPTIKGIARRPAHAAAASTPSGFVAGTTYQVGVKVGEITPTRENGIGNLRDLKFSGPDNTMCTFNATDGAITVTKTTGMGSETLFLNPTNPPSGITTDVDYNFLEFTVTESFTITCVPVVS